MHTYFKCRNEFSEERKNGEILHIMLELFIMPISWKLCITKKHYVCYKLSIFKKTDDHDIVT